MDPPKSALSAAMVVVTNYSSDVKMLTEHGMDMQLVFHLEQSGGQIVQDGILNCISILDNIKETQFT